MTAVTAMVGGGDGGAAAVAELGQVYYEVGISPFCCDVSGVAV